MTVVIEALQESDAPRCAELEEMLFPDDAPWSAQVFRDAIGAGHHYLAARSVTEARTGGPHGGSGQDGSEQDGSEQDGSELVGYAGLAFVAGPPQPEAEIHTISVDPARRRRGIGRLLLHGLLTEADAAGAAVFLEVRTDNEAARALYEAEGFVVVGFRPRYYLPSGADAHIMRREPKP